MAEESYIQVSAKGEAHSFVGPDSTNLYRAIMLKSSIGLHQKTKMIPTRGVTITKMFAMAGEYTGKKYKRGDHAKAIEDLTVWIETMKSAIPVIKDAE